MDNREAITLLRNLEESLDSYCGLNEKGKTAFHMAIEALNCSEIPNNSDTISRQQAIDALCKSECGWNNAECRHKDGTDFYVTCDNVKIIKSLPSVQPEIIRCKDCKYYKYGICMKIGANKSFHGFCDWAERGEQE